MGRCPTPRRGCREHSSEKGAPFLRCLSGSRPNSTDWRFTASPTPAKTCRKRGLQFFGGVGMFFAKNTPTVFTPSLFSTRKNPTCCRKRVKQGFPQAKSGKKARICSKKQAFHMVSHTLWKTFREVLTVFKHPHERSKMRKIPHKKGDFGEENAHHPPHGGKWTETENSFPKTAKGKAVGATAFPFNARCGTAGGA